MELASRRLPPRTSEAAWTMLAHEPLPLSARERVLALIALVTGSISLVSLCAVWSLSVREVDLASRSILSSSELGLHAAYAELFRDAKYVDMTHTIHPRMPVWDLFTSPTLGAARASLHMDGFIGRGESFSYAANGFIATSVTLPTDQLGTQLDPPAHWNEFGATIDDVPPTVSLRPLVVIDVRNSTRVDPGYHARAQDVLAWERVHGRIPAGAAVFFRTDWSARWEEYIEQGLPERFPGVSIDALRLLHLDRQGLLHGHEPLDTDMTPSLEGEAWLMHNGYLQVEGVTNLHLVPPTGALVSIGFAKIAGGTGGYARLVAICPSQWEHGMSIAEAPGAPLPSQEHPLRRDADGVLRPKAGAEPTRYCDNAHDRQPLGCPLPAVESAG